MFKLAWTDGWINLKRSFRETKYVYLLLGVVLIGGLFWSNASSGFMGVYIAWGNVIRSDYGKGKLIPDIFYMVPMDEKEKKRYIFYRSFGIEWMLSTLIGAIIFFEIFVLGEERSWIVFLLVVLLTCMICLKEQFYSVYKKINGKVYYPDMSTAARRFFWIFRINDFIFGLITMIGIGTVTSDSGTHSLSLYVGPVVVVYMVISVLYFIRYVQKCMARMELPEML